MNHQHRDHDRPLGPPPPWRADDPGPDGCARPMCGHPVPAHDLPDDACSMCDCTGYVAPFRARAVLVLLVLAAAFIVAAALLSGAHP